MNWILASPILFSLVEAAETNTETLNLFSPENLASYLVTGVLAILNLLITYFIVKLLLYRPIMRFAKARQNAIDKEIDSAKNRVKEAEMFLKNAKESELTARRKASQILLDAQEKAVEKEMLSKQLLAEKLQEQKAQALLEIESAKFQALQEQDEALIDLSQKVLQAVIPKLSLQDSNQVILNDALEHIKEETESNKGACA